MRNSFAQHDFPVSQKVYAWLLRAYPPAHRAEYGEAMAQLFRDQCRDAWREAGGWGLTKLWLRVLPDWVSTSIGERIAALNERKTMNDKLTNISRDRSAPSAIFISVAVAVFLITIIGATLMTFILPESFASTCRIKIEKDLPEVANGTNTANFYDPYFIQTQFEIINSQLVLSQVVATLNLNVEWGKKYFAGETLKTTESIEILRGRMVLAPVRNTTIIAITVYSDDRNEAALIANTVADSYINWRLESRKQLATERNSSGQNLSPPVLITDRAEPGRAPVKPNKPLNIFIGGVAGIFLGLMAGGAAALFAAKLGNRAPKNAAVA